MVGSRGCWEERTSGPGSKQLPAKLLNFMVIMDDSVRMGFEGFALIWQLAMCLDFLSRLYSYCWFSEGFEWIRRIMTLYCIWIS
jgi:hypothetical protein